MYPFQNLHPVLSAFLIVGGPTGLAISARTLYLAVRKLLKLRPVLASTTVGIFMIAIAFLLYLVLGVDNAIVGLAIIGAADITIMGTPLAKYHFLTQLDPAVAQRVQKGSKSWLDAS